MGATIRSGEVATFWRYIRSSLDRLVRLTEGLNPAELNWRPPAPQTNSLYVLTTHTLGNAEENLLGALCGEPGQRDRDAEFRASGTTPEAIRERWRLLDARLDTALAALDPAALDASCQHPRRGALTGREVLIIVARHAAEHLGQAELTRDLMRAAGVTPRTTTT